MQKSQKNKKKNEKKKNVYFTLSAVCLVIGLLLLLIKQIDNWFSFENAMFLLIYIQFKCPLVKWLMQFSLVTCIVIRLAHSCYTTQHESFYFRMPIDKSYFALNINVRLHMLYSKQTSRPQMQLELRSMLAKLTNTN